MALFDENASYHPRLFSRRFMMLDLYSHSFCFCPVLLFVEVLISCLFSSAALHHDPFAYLAHAPALLAFLLKI
jgi:hypothetical protein